VSPLDAAPRAALQEGSRDLPSTPDRYRPLYRAVAHLRVPEPVDDWTSEVDRRIDELETDVGERAHRRLAVAREERAAYTSVRCAGVFTASA
jgi:hypothetical protein